MPSGRAVIEFLAVGGSTLLLFPAAWGLRSLFGADTSEFVVSFVAFYAANVINNPHFAVTYLLFYKEVRERTLGAVYPRAQQVRYWLAGYAVPLALVLVLGAALLLRSAPLLGGCIQAMLVLVGWHYVKQGFGVLAVLSAWRGVSLLASERRALLAHAICGWLFARTNPRDPGRELESDGVIFHSFTHPAGLDRLTQAAFALSTLAVVAVFVLRFRRGQSLPPLAALCGYFVAIWLWTAFSRVEPLMVYLIPALHSVQYLFFVLLQRRNQARAVSGPPLFRPSSAAIASLVAGAIGLGWVLFRGAPDALDGLFSNPREQSDLGPTPFLAAILTFVNVHHYFMDAVIWRREQPETRYLFDAAPSNAG